MTLSVSNPNPANTAIFSNLEQTFNYKRSHSSKSNQYRVTRGAQGDALKELGTIPYMLINSGESGQEKQWKYPLVFQHNKVVDNVYIQVDRKNRVIKHRIARSTCGDDTDTKVTITLPALDKASYESLQSFCRLYTLFNTHMSFKLIIDGNTYPSLLASLPMSENYNNPNSIYCYSKIEFEDFLTDIHDRSISVYKALKDSGFRELNQPDGFEDLKDITIADLTPKKTNEIHNRLRNSMLAMSEVFTPYHYSKTNRREALIKRYSGMSPYDLDYDKAKYERTDEVYINNNDGSRSYPRTASTSVDLARQNQTSEK